MIILFTGPSGSGKDTQAQIISMNSSFQNVSTGDLVRDISNGPTSIQTYIRKCLDTEFPNDELIYGLLQVFMKYARGEDFILNGAVRRATQIQKLDEILAKLNQKIDHVFNFVAPREVLIDRLNNRLYCKVCKSNYNTKTNPPRIHEKCDRCGSVLFKRDDDDPNAIENRLNEFNKYNEEIIEEYKKRGIVTNIDATQSIGEIKEEISKVLDNVLNK